jgi:hypothetical protein
MGNNRVIHLDRNVANASHIIGLATMDRPVSRRVTVIEQFKVQANRRMPEKRDVDIDDAIGKSGVAGKRGEIDALVVHRAIVICSLLETKDGAVKIGCHFDVLDDDIEVGDSQHVPFRIKRCHCFLLSRKREIFALRIIPPGVDGNRSFRISAMPSRIIRIAADFPTPGILHAPDCDFPHIRKIGHGTHKIPQCAIDRHCLLTR